MRWLNIDDSVKETGSYRFQASTSADGAYRLAGLVPGPYEVTFELGGFRSRRVSMLLRADSPLVDQQGLALPGAEVTATSSGAPVQRAVTDRAGGFRFPDLRPGVWEVVAQLPGFEARSAVADVVFGEPAAVRVALALGYSLAEEAVVVGSRRATAQRTVSESVVPVDVLGAEDLEAQPHADMAHLLRALTPSFNVNTQPISDAATVVRPVNLRNLAPDHLLVLVNGKRRHRAAVIAWLGNGISDGSQGPAFDGYVRQPQHRRSRFVPAVSVCDLRPCLRCDRRPFGRLLPGRQRRSADRPVGFRESEPGVRRCATYQPRRAASGCRPVARRGEPLGALAGSGVGQAGYDR